MEAGLHVRIDKVASPGDSLIFRRIYYFRACRSCLRPLRGKLGIFESQTDVGSVVPPGVTVYDPASKTYTISSAGENLWSTTDAFHFVWKKMSGDVSLTADIDFPIKTGNPNPHRKALLMFRQTLDADGVYADAALHGSGLTALQYRRTPGATTQDIELDISAPKKLRLEKRGDTITMFLSMADEPLHQVGSSIKLHLQEPFYVGLGVCSHNKDVTEKAIFSNVELQSLTHSSSAQLTLYSTLQTIGIQDNFRTARMVYTSQGTFRGSELDKGWNHAAVQSGWQDHEGACNGRHADRFGDWCCHELQREPWPLARWKIAGHHLQHAR